MQAFQERMQLIAQRDRLQAQLNAMWQLVVALKNREVRLEELTIDPEKGAWTVAPLTAPAEQPVDTASTSSQDTPGEPLAPLPQPAS